MTRKGDITRAAIAILIVCLLMTLTSGCTEEQKKTPPVWGKGELPADFVNFFGTGNNSRLNKAQNDMLNRHQVVMHGMDQAKDGKKVHIPGLVDAVVQLDARVKVLEAVDPNRIEAVENTVAIEELAGRVDALEAKAGEIKHGHEIHTHDAITMLNDGVMAELNEVAK